MSILLDVGAHFGQSAVIAIDPKWGFKEIHAFEPSKMAFEKLKCIKSEVLICHNFGLFSKNTELELLNAGQVVASIYTRSAISQPKKELIKLRRASDWLSENIEWESEIYLKLNCEGSEVDILQDLIDSELITKFKSIYIDFDIRKIPGQEHRREIIEKQLLRLKVPFNSWEEIQDMLTNNEKKIPYYSFTKWLIINKNQIDVGIIGRISYALKSYLDLNSRIKLILKSVLPPKLSKMLSKLMKNP
jgi:FkbM family methyltransferase